MAVTDLTNTKWLINSTTCTAGYGQFNIKGSYYRNGESYDVEAQGLYIGYSIQSVFEPVATANHIMTWAGALDVLAGDTIEFFSGTDVTNASLISWLTANATQITSGGSMYLGTSTISKMYLGQNEVSKVYLGQDLVYEKQASGITFTIGNTTFQADDGMTWGDWVNSSYNTGGFIITDISYIGLSGNDIVGIVSCDFSQKDTTPIIANQAYIIFNQKKCD